MGRSGVNRASSSDAWGPGFAPRPLRFKKYHFFTPKLKVSPEPGTPPDLWIECKGAGSNIGKFCSHTLWMAPWTYFGFSFVPWQAICVPGNMCTSNNRQFPNVIIYPNDNNRWRGPMLFATKLLDLVVHTYRREKRDKYVHKPKNVPAKWLKK